MTPPMTDEEALQMMESHHWTLDLIDWLKTEKPAAYREMKATGELMPWASKKALRALDQLIKLTDQKVPLDQANELVVEDLMSL